MVFVPPSWVPHLNDKDIPDSIPISHFLFDEQYGRCELGSSKAPFICGISGERHSASELRQRVDYLSRGLAKELSWSPNEGSEWDKVVTIFAQNTLDSLSVSWAVHHLSGISSPANAVYGAQELTHQVRQAKSRAIFTTISLLDIALAAAKGCGIPDQRVYLLSMPDDYATAYWSVYLSRFKTVEALIEEGSKLPALKDIRWVKGQGARQCAFLMFSSGTSGLPKGVMVSHKNIIANVLQLCAFEASDRTPETRNINLGVLPQSHIYGMVAICHTSVYRGESVVVLPKFSFQTFAKAIETFRVNVLYVVPPIILNLASRNPGEYDFSSVTEVFTGAAPLDAQVAWVLLMLYPRWKIRQAYGLTESATVISATSSTDILLGSCGSLISGVEVRLHSLQDGSEIHEYDTPGELFVRSPSITTLGYLDNEQATQETFVKGGWLRTGDEAMIVLNSNGTEKPTEHLKIVDRIKELIKSKGHQVAPAELEACLLTHPLVADSAVIAVPDRHDGELPKAFVTLKESQASTSPDEARSIIEDIDRFVRKQKASYKWLRGGIEIVDSIPKSPSGKILRRLLRDAEVKKQAPMARL